MKLHLLFVFLLAAPLIGRVLSSESSTTADACDAASAQASEVQSASTPAAPTASAAPAAPPTTTDTAKARALRPAPATGKPAPRRTSRAQATLFM